MPTFTYSAYAPDGSLAAGQIEAVDRTEAFAFLGSKRLQPVALEVSGSDTPEKSSKSETVDVPTPAVGGIRLKSSQLCLFTEELGELLEGGIQLEPALATMERRRELSSLKEVAAALRSKVRDGMSFSNALADTSPSFGKLYCSLVAAGEAAGARGAGAARQDAPPRPRRPPPQQTHADRQHCLDDDHGRLRRLLARQTIVLQSHLL